MLGNGRFAHDVAALVGNYRGTANLHNLCEDEIVKFNAARRSEKLSFDSGI